MFGRASIGALALCVAGVAVAAVSNSVSSEQSTELNVEGRALANEVRLLGPTVEAELPYVSTFEIMAQYPHDPQAFTQGLSFDESGALFESDGLFGESTVREVEVRTGQSRKQQRMPQEMFGEGLQALGNKLIQLTWKNNAVFEYRKDNMQLIRTVPVNIGREGWGLATDPLGQTLYVTDSTDALFHVEPETYRVVKRLKIVDKRLGPKAIFGVNELEWVKGELWGNVYPMYQGKASECIARIDPGTGEVKGWIDMRGLLDKQAPHVRRAPHNFVLNGIAYHEPTDRLYITGKKWNNLYQVRIKGDEQLSTATHVHHNCQLG